jgi:hypothetical protein
MSEETKAPTAPEAPATAENEQATGAELTVNDLAALKQIIDVASQRGTFKPNEMVTVGQTYAKLEAFLAEIQAAQQAAETEQGA